MSTNAKGQELEYRCPGCGGLSSSNDAYRAHITDCNDYADFKSRISFKRCAGSVAALLSAYPRGASGAAMLQAEPIEDRFKVERDKRLAQRRANRTKRIRIESEKAVAEEEGRRAARHAKVHVSIQGEVVPSLETRPSFFHPHAQMPLVPPSDDACWECKCVDYEHQDWCTQQEKDGAHQEYYKYPQKDIGDGARHKFPENAFYQSVYGIKAQPSQPTSQAPQATEPAQVIQSIVRVTRSELKRADVN